MTLVDANVILRYLLADVPEQAEAAKAAIDDGAAVTVEVVAEVVYVLRGVYGVPRDEVSQTLGALLPRLECDRLDVLLGALDSFRDTRLDFVDCVLLANAALGKAEVLTFDKKLAAAIRRAAEA